MQSLLTDELKVFIVNSNQPTSELNKMIKSEFIPKSGKFIAVFKNHPLYKNTVEMYVDSDTVYVNADDKVTVTIDMLDEADHFLIPEPKLEPIVVYDMPTKGRFTAYLFDGECKADYRWSYTNTTLLDDDNKTVDPMKIKELARFYIIGVK